MNAQLGRANGLPLRNRAHPRHDLSGGGILEQITDRSSSHAFQKHFRIVIHINQNDLDSWNLTDNFGYERAVRQSRSNRIQNQNVSIRCSNGGSNIMDARGDAAHIEISPFIQESGESLAQQSIS